YLAPGPVTA
nr:Chain C, Peptide antigen YLAPGPVTA [synthetic construct]5EU4_F Chain F, Peptide antigen YLAPGPVTA [synthetic construct]